LEVQRAAVEDEDESAAPSDTLIKKIMFSSEALKDYFSVKVHRE